MATSAQIRAQAELERRKRGVVGVNPFAEYRFEPIRYITDKLGWHPWAGDGDHPGQMEVLQAYELALRQLHERFDYEQGTLTADQLQYWQPGQVIRNRIRVEAGHTVGKCSIITDMITTSDGKRQTMGDLVGKNFSLPTLVDGKVVHVPARAGLNKHEPVYKLTTDKGRNITRNAHHPVWSAKAIFEAGRRPIIDVKGWTPVIDLQVGDLVAVAEQLPEPDMPICLPIEEVKLIAYLLGDGGTSTKSVVRFSQMVGIQLNEFADCARKLGCDVVHVANYDYTVYGAGGRSAHCNPVLNLCRLHEIQGKTALQKRVPSAIFQLPNQQLSVFLSRLYSTDGWATARKDGGVEIGYASSCIGLIRDIQELLLRFGVHANIFRKEKVNSWSLTINNKLDAYNFIERIGIFGKEKATENVKSACDYRVESHARAVGDRPYRPRWQYKNAEPGTRWEKVESVEYMGEEWTVAIEVPEHHTYLTEFWEHNTMVASGIFSHFFDTCPPAIIYSFAPSYEQINDLLWKEIRTARRRANLPGRTLETPELKLTGNHFAKGRATNDSHGRGTERVQGQHGKYLMFIVDEAEGVADFVYDAIESMASGGIAIVLMLANPRTRTSKFYEQRTRADVASFRISCIYHPNVLADREIVPGAVRRDYVEKMLDDHCDIVDRHDPDSHTFELPWRDGVIYKPDAEYMFRVLGIAPANLSDNTFITTDRYEAACQREIAESEPAKARIGIDVARYGTDAGTIYCRWNGRIWRHRQITGQNTNAYREAILLLCEWLKAQDVTDVQVRVDGGGGYASGIIDPLQVDMSFQAMFDSVQLLEVHNNGEAFDASSYADKVTEMYAEAAQTIAGVTIQNPPALLEADLTERPYTFVNKSGRSVKKLVEKEKFKDKHGRSPDDGDGFVLAAAPDHIFEQFSAGTWGTRRKR